MEENIIIKTLELFGGIGAPRKAFKNIGIDIKAIDYVEIDPKPVKTYNEMFKKDLMYKTQNVIGYNLKPDVLIHGSPCQDFSIAGYQKGAEQGSETRSSLMWETISIIKQMGIWKPRVVVWENVKNVLSKHMKHNFDKYLEEMKKMGYTNNYEILNAMDFGLPQRRERVFTISCLDGKKFDFDKLEHRKLRPLSSFLQTNVDEYYTVTQPSILRAIGKKGVSRATIIKDYCYTITTRQDRCPAQVISLGNGKYRFLTEKECWLLQGFSEEDFEAAAKVNSRRDLYKQAGNSIPVTILESIFKQVLEEWNNKQIAV
ncbi:DNA (cytosine-5)-methyltransferase 1 [Clostridium acetobutylicum]|uniref:Cytosine-specific methyltransferase n=1 Tax=Clostridium acetobutylicum (strain ATCC 824 / DSM 792 / JCM 1419 / IAM 19013 / LMG 5710 / NBRC 13948 / NRRL B-527 / VKM B-1787 / 2291 / W) TaxID=272562 RepID=Q97JQ1_CLOAB|nr:MULTISPECIES: DNA cytosine methyltransferase [Clostridium]AAK79194.1 DNA-methyltransferase (cytosine-specific) [Clostridium acetobutylicum ATCC 824]ADZ20272.1 DNA-methyltransferase (cytosine-specific) [Clostridium acetobutylicum EA 2018]AEI34179.1 DNA-methyltransferase (cytosine-specific) [Clostridium acetobutylicum DSM 1731]AWV81556.1 DNA cytosine methyltransferase [Clostridium acetobutylicum]MBC2393196.1 DNA cytosine methyltransferase [Clostridium acetobutylicum]